MKTKLFLIAFLSISFLSAQENKAFFNLNVDAQIDITATSEGNYKVINVEVSNFGTKTANVVFPEGGLFVNLDSTEQNLVVLFYDKIIVEPGKSKEIVIGTACANPKRKIPSKRRTTWVYDYDAKVGDLIRYYHNNRSLIEMMTGKEHHDTFLKRHNFLQMCVWVYYDADKKQILDFATKYLFDGDKDKAQLFIDVFYPLAVTFINIYKGL